MIEFSDFAKVDMRVGRVVEALPFPDARNPSYKLRVDFGPDLGEQVSVAQLTVTYPDPAALVGRLVVAVVNFPPRWYWAPWARARCRGRSGSWSRTRGPRSGCASARPRIRRP